MRLHPIFLETDEKLASLLKVSKEEADRFIATVLLDAFGYIQGLDRSQGEKRLSAWLSKAPDYRSANIKVLSPKNSNGIYPLGMWWLKVCALAGIDPKELDPPSTGERFITSLRNAATKIITFLRKNVAKPVKKAVIFVYRKIRTKYLLIKLHWVNLSHKNCSTIINELVKLKAADKQILEASLYCLASSDDKVRHKVATFLNPDTRDGFNYTSEEILIESFEIFIELLSDSSPEVLTAYLNATAGLAKKLSNSLKLEDLAVKAINSLNSLEFHPDENVRAASAQALFNLGIVPLQSKGIEGSSLILSLVRATGAPVASVLSTFKDVPAKVIYGRRCLNLRKSLEAIKQHVALYRNGSGDIIFNIRGRYVIISQTATDCVWYAKLASNDIFNEELSSAYLEEISPEIWIGASAGTRSNKVKLVYPSGNGSPTTDACGHFGNLDEDHIKSIKSLISKKKFESVPRYQDYIKEIDGIEVEVFVLTEQIPRAPPGGFIW